MPAPSVILSNALEHTRRAKLEGGEWVFAIVDFLLHTESYSGYNNATARWKSLATKYNDLAARSIAVSFQANGHVRKCNLDCGDAQLLHDIVSILPKREGKDDTRKETVCFFAVDNTDKRNAYLYAQEATRCAGRELIPKRALDVANDRKSKHPRIAEPVRSDDDGDDNEPKKLVPFAPGQKLIVTATDNEMTVATDGSPEGLRRTMEIISGAFPNVRSVSLVNNIKATSVTQNVSTASFGQVVQAETVQQATVATTAHQVTSAASADMTTTADTINQVVRTETVHQTSHAKTVQQTTTATVSTQLVQADAVQQTNHAHSANQVIQAEAVQQAVVATVANQVVRAEVAHQANYAEQMNMVNRFERSNGPVHLIERAKTKYCAGDKRDASKAEQLLAMHAIKDCGEETITSKAYIITNARISTMMTGCMPRTLKKKLSIRRSGDLWRNYLLPERAEDLLTILSDIDFAIENDEMATGSKLTERCLRIAVASVLAPYKQQTAAEMTRLKMNAMQYFFGLPPYKRNDRQ